MATLVKVVSVTDGGIARCDCGNITNRIIVRLDNGMDAVVYSGTAIHSVADGQAWVFVRYAQPIPAVGDTVELVESAKYWPSIRRWSMAKIAMCR